MTRDPTKGVSLVTEDPSRRRLLQRARAQLRKADPVLARLIDDRPDFDPRAWMAQLPPMDLYGALLFQITGQQLSVPATRRILGRIEALFDGRLPTPPQLLDADPAAIREAGLSWRKINTLRDLAQRFADGRLDAAVLAQLPDDDLMAVLTTVPGIGPWTVQGALILALQREDVVLPGDLALRKAIEVQRPTRPSAYTTGSFNHCRSMAAVSQPGDQLPVFSRVRARSRDGKGGACAMGESGMKSTFAIGTVRVRRSGYGAMQLAGPYAFGPPPDRETAIGVLRAAVAAGVDHIDTAEYYGPCVVNDLIREALHPYPNGLAIVSKVAVRRDDGGAVLPFDDPDQLREGIEDNLRSLRIEQLAAVNLRLPGGGRIDARFDDQLAAMVGSPRERAHRGRRAEQRQP